MRRRRGRHDRHPACDIEELEQQDGVSADPDRIGQVISNLVSNAIKFTPSGGRVEVRLSGAEREVQLTVMDSGVGISREFCRSCSNGSGKQRARSRAFTEALGCVRVLIVDDDANARELFTSVLEKCQAEVMAAASVAEALTIWERWRPDVLLARRTAKRRNSCANE